MTLNNLKKNGRFISAAIFALFCFYSAVSVFSAGSSRALSEFVFARRISFDASIEELMVLANEAVRLSYADPEACFARGVISARTRMFAEASLDFERAIMLRPLDYALWLEFGRASEQTGDKERALIAFQEAARLAPYHVQTHWQLGNFLLRINRRDEAFIELRRAADLNPERFPYLAELAWSAFDGDANAVERALQPASASEHLTLGVFFVEHGQTNEAVGQLRQAGGVKERDLRLALKRLFDADAFRAAYALWIANQDETHSIPTDSGVDLINGSFEQDIHLTDEIGFGWQINREIKTIRHALDSERPENGARSLRIDFNGQSEPSSAIVSQLFPVEPKTRYRVKFFARAEDLVTGALPFVSIVEAGNRGESRELGKSAIFQNDIREWREFSVEFAATGEAANAARLILRREKCGDSPCPIYGKVWLDNFSIYKINGVRN